ncbi:hypothetical protein [Ruegeria atlantica]|nr:hypothetical protein [Ruegeria atlantica]
MRIFVSAITLFFGAASAEAEISASEIWSECRPSASCVIEYDHLSTQDVEPFLFLGRVVDSDHPQWRKYRKAIRKFPDVQSCLAKEEQKKENPNLLKLDWEGGGYSSGVELCIYRISRSLVTLDRVQSWMSYHDFRVVGYSRYRSENFVSTGTNQPVGNVSGYWTVQQYRERNPTLLWRFFEFDLIYSYGIVLGISEEFKVVGAHVTMPTK